MNIGIIGLGLIGGSIGRALIKKTDHVVYGYDTSSDTMLKASFLPAINHPLTDSDYICLDVLIIALNPDAFVSVAKNIIPKLKNDAIVIDIAGNKSKVLNEMRKLALDYPLINFIGTHPMAGREYSGINHSTPYLFEKASILLIPLSQEISKISLLKMLLLSIGFSDVIITTDKIHDKIIAYTSQLAHIISSSYIKSPTAIIHDGYSAGSFKDISRVARLNADMWAELMTDNSDNLLFELDHFIASLNEYRQALTSNKRDQLRDLLQTGSDIKTAIDKTSREYKRKL
ncbi:MAG: prephenate dehydrogenase [Christensenellaceae bacterium]|jgi:prephenate dehydrogenase|nr:prephenate dehydrogenase [Christensenellaceae bacterium]